MSGVEWVLIGLISIAYIVAIWKFEEISGGK